VDGFTVTNVQKIKSPALELIFAGKINILFPDVGAE
jgi:hypothetical protein